MLCPRFELLKLERLACTRAVTVLLLFFVWPIDWGPYLECCVSGPTLTPSSRAVRCLTTAVTCCRVEYTPVLVSVLVLVLVLVVAVLVVLVMVVSLLLRNMKA